MCSPALSPALISDILSDGITSPEAMAGGHVVRQRKPQAPMDTSVTSRDIKQYQDMRPGFQVSTPQTVYFRASQAVADTSPLGILVS